jgi:hypothetical protein
MDRIKQRFPAPACRPAAQALAAGALTLWLAGSAPWAASAQPETAPGVLQSASEIRRLTPEQAAKQLPVRLRGVVTFRDEGLYSRFVQDATAGIYVQEMTNMPSFVAGQMVEVEGVTGPGEYAPVIVPTHVKILGEGQFPAARPVTAADLVNGTEDSQFVEITGIVRSVRYEEETQCHLIDLVTGGERFTTYAKELPTSQPGTLVDSTVKVRGVCSTQFNRLRQLFGFRLLVARPGDVIVEIAAPVNPFDTAVQPINSLLRFTPQATYSHRVKVVGTVSCQEAGRAVFIQDETEGLYVQTRQRMSLQPGDRIEVLGFPAKGEYTPMLQDAIYRKTGDGKAPAPMDLDVDEVLKGTHDCRLVRLQANLLERTRRGREQFLVLESGGFTFHAHFSQDADVTGMDQLLNGSELSVTGICLIERGSGWQAGEGWRAKSFRLLLPAAGDVRVLKAPPWWTQPDKLRLAGILSVVVLAALVLIDVVRRRPKATNAST